MTIVFESIALLIGITGSNPLKTSGDDAEGVLRACTSVCDALPAQRVYARIERRSGEPRRVARVTLWGERLDRSDFHRLTRLRGLDAVEIRGDCRVAADGVSELYVLPNLRRFSLSGPLDDSRLKALCDLVSLEDLRLDRGLGGSGLRDEDIAYLAGLCRLRRLRLGLHGLELTDKSLAHIEKLAHLEELDLSASDEVTDAGLAGLKVLTSLRALNLARIGERGLTGIRNLPHLQQLSIETMDPTAGNADLSMLRPLKTLAVFNLGGNDKARVRLPSALRDLELGQWWFRKEGRLSFQPPIPHLDSLCIHLPPRCAPASKPVDLAWLSSFPRLRTVHLDYAIEKDLMTLPELPSLRALALTGQSGTITDDGMRILARFCNLESLTTLNRWCVTDAGMEPLRNLTGLREVQFEGVNGISAKGLESLWELKNLRVLHLDISGDSLKGSVDAVLAHISTLSDLEALTLRGNLTDAALARLATLKKLRSLDLTRCDGFSDETLLALMSSLPGLQVVERRYDPK